jgi:hypothetical protein
MILHFLNSLRNFRPSWALPVLLAPITLFLGGCAGMGGGGGGGNFHATAYAPTNPSDVRVKVSLRTQNVYVEEGDRLLMATPTCVGKAGYPTPTGDYHVIDKIRDKRSSEYGYWVDGSQAYAGSAAQGRPGYHYIGYPMAFWVEFTPGFGFHEGPIWPFPKSHGCLHIHPAASAKLFELVHIGTPVEVADSLPEDSKYHVDRPSDYTDPDPPASLMTSSQFFDMPRDTELISGPVPAATN